MGFTPSEERSRRLILNFQMRIDACLTGDGAPGDYPIKYKFDTSLSFFQKGTLNKNHNTYPLFGDARSTKSILLLLAHQLNTEMIEWKETVGHHGAPKHISIKTLLLSPAHLCNKSLLFILQPSKNNPHPPSEKNP